MRHILLGLLLVSCGKSDSSSTSSTSSPEVTKVSAAQNSTCGAGLTITSTYNTGLDYVTTPYYPVVMSSTTAYPEKCDDTSKTVNNGYYACISDATSMGTQYFFRVCVFNATDKTYSAGLTGTYTIPAKQ